MRRSCFAFLLVLSVLFLSVTGTTQAAKCHLVRPFSLSGQVAAQQRPAPSTKELPAIVLNTELTSVEGGAFNLSSYREDVLVIGFWASWCAPCRYQIEDLVRLDSEF